MFNQILSRLSYLYVIRLGIAVFLIFRILVLVASRSLFPWSVISTISFVLYTTVITLATIIYSDLRRNRKWLAFQVIVDTLFSAIIYILSYDPSSESYFLFLLPVMTTVDHFRRTKFLEFFNIIFIVSSGSLLFLLLSNQSAMSLLEIIIRDLLPRVSFFWLIVFLITLRVRLLQDLTEELEAVRLTSIKILENETLDRRLEAIIDAATNLLNAKGCLVYLKNPYLEALELVATKGIDNKYLKPGYLLPFGQGVSGHVWETLTSIIVNDYSSSPYRLPEFAHLFDAVIAVPMLVAGEPLGILVVFDAQLKGVGSRFGEREQVVLVRLAQHAAVAIRSSQLSDLAQEQANVMKLLNLASREINLSLNLQDTLQAIVRYAWQLTLVYNKKPPLYIGLGLLDDKMSTLRFEATYPENILNDLLDQKGVIDLQGKNYGVISKAIESQTSQLSSDISQNNKYTNFNQSTKTQLTVVVSSPTEIIGIINVEHADLNAFPEILLKNMEVLAAQAATSIENALLFKLEQQRRVQVENFFQTSVKMARMNGIKAVSDQILESLHELLPYHEASVQIIKGDKRQIVASTNKDLSDANEWMLRSISEDQLIQDIIERRQIYFLFPPHDHPYLESLGKTKDIQSWIGIPLVFGEKVIGLLTIEHLEKITYTKYDQQLLELFANHATSILQNSILLEELAQQVIEVNQAKQYLEVLLEHLEDHRNLALIGLVYGESIHFARNKLGMAKTKADSIAAGYYGEVSNEVQSNAKRILDYINQYLKILDETQQNAHHSPEPILINIHEIIDYVIASKRISADINVIRDYQAHQPAIYAPQTQLIQVFYVIIQNALDAMKYKGGELKIHTKTIVNKDGHKYIQVAISDTGRGIPEHLRADFFRPKINKSKDYISQGSGLGLVWAYSFLHTYNGNIDYKTKIGEGTTMYLLIPIDFREGLNIIDIRN